MLRKATADQRQLRMRPSGKNRCPVVGQRLHVNRQVRPHCSCHAHHGWLEARLPRGTATEILRRIFSTSNPRIHKARSLYGLASREVLSTSERLRWLRSTQPRALMHLAIHKKPQVGCRFRRMKQPTRLDPAGLGRDPM
jgi:hypothetical protein